MADKTTRPVSLPPPDRQCTHVGTTAGPDKRCGSWAIRGGSVCIYHGGASPVTQQAAKIRLLAMADVAFHVLFEAMEKADWTNRVKAAVAVASMAGFGPKATLKIENPGSHEDLSTLSMDQLEQKAMEVANEIRAARYEAATSQFDGLTLEGQVAQ